MTLRPVRSCNEQISYLWQRSSTMRSSTAFALDRLSVLLRSWTLSLKARARVAANALPNDSNLQPATGFGHVSRSCWGCGSLLADHLAETPFRQKEIGPGLILYGERNLS